MDAKQNISSIRHFLTMRHTDCDAFAEMGLPDVVLYTDGSASLSSGTAGWGVFAHRSDTSETSLWGPVTTDPAEFNRIGASRPTNNTEEISAIYHALKWLSGDSKKHPPGPPPRVNLLTDSLFCVRLF